MIPYPSPTYYNVALNHNLFQEALSLSDNGMTTTEKQNFNHAEGCSRVIN